MSRPRRVSRVRSSCMQAYMYGSSLMPACARTGMTASAAPSCPYWIADMGSQDAATHHFHWHCMAWPFARHTAQTHGATLGALTRPCKEALEGTMGSNLQLCTLPAPDLTIYGMVVLCCTVPANQLNWQKTSCLLALLPLLV